MPRRLRAYRTPELLRGEVSRQIREMVDKGIIVPSQSPMVSPFVCVLKGPQGQKGIRLAVDYRHDNRFSVGDPFPMPDIPDVLQRVSGSSYISCFDARSGYWQIPVRPESRWLTAFSYDEGLFEFIRMPFGLKSAGSTFMRVVSEIIRPIRAFTEPFIDDFAVHSHSWDEHLMHLAKFFEVVGRSGLTLNLDKSRFAQSKVPFLGHVIGSGKIAPDPLKCSLSREIKPPLSKRDVKRLVGFFSYFRSFIPNLAQTAHVITELTKKGVPNKIVWKKEHQEALDKLVCDLNHATTLNTINYSKPFLLFSWLPIYFYFEKRVGFRSLTTKQDSFPTGGVRT